MGIDRHELEHRNWRPAAAVPRDATRDIAEQLDTSIVPGDGIADDVELRPASSKPRAKRAKTDQLR